MQQRQLRSCNNMYGDWLFIVLYVKTRGEIFRYMYQSVFLRLILIISIYLFLFFNSRYSLNAQTAGGNLYFNSG